MIQRFLQNTGPYTFLTVGYLLIMLIGSVLLSLPVFHAQTVPLLDNLFTAISAVSTTGLVTVSTSDSYNLGGEILIIILIQIGGVGYMSLASFVVLSSRRKISKLSEQLIRTDFSLPSHFSLQHFIRSVILFAFFIELVGAILLYICFRLEGIPDALWQAIFHSISAFCTAGFSLFNNSLEDFKFDFWVNLIITLLSLGGSIGFIVFADVYRRIIKKKGALTYTSRIILRFTLVALVASFLILLVSEDAFYQYTLGDEMLISLFQGMTAFTTVGFNTFPIGDMSSGGIFFIIILMLAGASPSGTGGGIKSTTIVALFAVMKCTLQGRKKITFSGREIPEDKLRLAVTNFFFYVLVLITGIFLLAHVESQAVYSIIFEATSALGTVGLSTGATGALTAWGKVIIIVLMFLGRIGPITFGLALLKSKEDTEVVLTAEDIAI